MILFSDVKYSKVIIENERCSVTMIQTCIHIHTVGKLQPAHDQSKIIFEIILKNTNIINSIYAGLWPA